MPTAYLFRPWCSAQVFYKAVATEPPWIFKFETLFDCLLQCDSNARWACSRLSRNI